MSEHVGTFIGEELKARGWTSADAARGMLGDPAVNELTLDMWIACGDEPGVLMSQEEAENLARAFGTSADMWLNLHASWRASQ